jgi:hypothetical protein
MWNKCRLIDVQHVWGYEGGGDSDNNCSNWKLITIIFSKHIVGIPGKHSIQYGSEKDVLFWE